MSEGGGGGVSEGGREGIGRGVRQGGREGRGRWKEGGYVTQVPQHWFNRLSRVLPAITINSFPHHSTQDNHHCLS